ncbi:MAG TPA: D-alanine--D-alanine ligase [bacterium]|nr:D-alanine--D-alanine ligase [bacterium]
MASVPPRSSRRRLRVAVLFGGPSAEREVSLASGGRVLSALDPEKYDALPVEITSEGKWLPRPDLLTLPAPPSVAGAPAVSPPPAGGGAASPKKTGGTASGPAEGRASAAVPALAAASHHIDEVVREGDIDVVFIALHGPYGEDGTVQGLLELLGIPYTGSGVLASALAMDKLRSRQVLQASGLPVPAWILLDAAQWPAGRAELARRVGRDLGYPCVVKPNAQGSSIGVTIAGEESALDAAVEEALGYGNVVLIEEYLRGIELTCGILEDPDTGVPQVLPVIEIVPKREFFTYEAKYQGASEEICPARIPGAAAAKARDLALRAHQVLGCEGFSRVDLFLCGTDVVVLEVNTIPGLTEGSLIPLAAHAAGIEYPELLNRMIAAALRRDRARRRIGPAGGHDRRTGGA